MRRFLINDSSLYSIILILLVSLFLVPNHLLVSLHAQNANKNLSPLEIKSLPDDLFNMIPSVKFPVSFAFKITDKSGTYYTLLTEHIYSDSANSVLIDTIQAFTIKNDINHFTIQWSLKDFILTDESKGEIEASIWFWTKYSQIEDIDNDGLCDFIMVYGSKAQYNSFDEGRLKIIIYYKGRKFATIRHRNSIEDFGRFTTIDSSFYKLPEAIQNKTISIITTIENDGYAVFPNNLHDAFKKKLLLVENE